MANKETDTIILSGSILTEMKKFIEDNQFLRDDGFQDLKCPSHTGRGRNQKLAVINSLL